MTILKANKIESGHDMRMNVGHIWESRNAYHVTKHSVDILLLCCFLFSTIQFFFPSDGITLSVYNNISCVCVCFGEGHPISRFNTMTYDAIRMAFQ